MKTIINGCLLIALVFIAGCAAPVITRQTNPYPRPSYTLDDCRASAQKALPRDKVLWDYRLATEAMRQGLFDEAKQSLDDALPTIGAIMAKTKDAAAARNVFKAEAKKTFLGEPYERVMAYYYRGIIYWMDGEVDNAHACFINAQFQDNDLFEKQYSSDYALLDYLDALTMSKMGNDGSDALARAKEHDAHSGLPELNTNANVLVFCEFGQGPQKYATGEYKQELRFASAQATVTEQYVNGQLTFKQINDIPSTDRPSARMTIGDQILTVAAADDLYFQATTRGGRAMDHVLANKAVFKKTTDTVGNTAIVVGASVAAASSYNGGNSDAAIAGLAIMAVGLIAKGIAKAANPEADVRCWDNLPQHLGLAVLQLPVGKHEATVDFLDASGGTNSTKTVSFEIADAKKDTVIFLNDR